MNLHKLIFTENACFKAGRTITPSGILVHSTGANNPFLKRYVGPDDGLLGRNQYNNHWNQDKPGGRQVCVHGFIGKLADGSIATYQTLPWNHRGWHAGGKANDMHIGFEICEDNLTDAAYFRKVFNEAADLCVYLCRLYNLTEKDIICHSEGYKLGIASNHADVMHWFPRHGESMDSFRAAVRKSLEGTEQQPAQTSKYFRVRKSWSDAWSQKGAFRNLDYAKACADRNAGYSVFDDAGQIVYTGRNTNAPAFATYTVADGDTLWGIAAKLLGNGARYREIMALNGLTSYMIRPGQLLKIPSGAEGGENCRTK
jgi:N-acetylmuramoyl-L-alanine amidase